MMPHQGRRRRGGGSGGMCPPPPTFKSGGVQVGFSPPPPPTFGQTKCSNFDIFSYFVAKNAKFSWLASLANFTLSIFSTLANLKFSYILP